MKKKLKLIIFLISFSLIVNAQDCNYFFDVFFEDGDSLPYIMRQGYDEYYKDKLITRHGREIKFLYLLPPKYKEVKDTLEIKISEHLDKTYKKDSLLHFTYLYEYIEGYWEKYIPSNILPVYTDEYSYGVNNVYIYPRKILSYYERIDTSFSEEAFDSIQNQILYFPLTYYKIDTPFRVVTTLSFNEKLVEDLPIAKVYHLNGLWREPKRPSSYACVLRESNIIQIQRALTKRGYFVVLNDRFDEATKKALISFQTDYNNSHKSLNSNLIVGKLGKNTLKALGIEPFNNMQFPKYQYKYSPWNKVRY